MTEVSRSEKPVAAAPEAGPAAPAAAAAPEAPPLRVVGLARGSGLLLALGFAPLVGMFFVNQWRHKEYYQFFPLALAGVGYLGWRGFKAAERPLQSGSVWVVAPLLLVSFALLAAGALLWSPWLGAVAALFGLMGTVWWLGGARLLRVLLPAGLLLLTVIPPPLGLDQKLTLKLRGVAVVMSSRLLDLLQVTHAISGTVIDLPRQKLLVEEACSGINSLLSTTAVCLFYCLWRRRSVVPVILSLGATVGFVLLGNMARITLGAWANYHYKIDLLSGWKHETIGLILFAGYLGLIASFDQLLVFFTESGKVRPGMLPVYPLPESEPVEEPPPAPPPARVVRVSSRWAWAVAVLFALLVPAQLWAWYKNVAFDPMTRVVAKIEDAALRKGAKFDLPEQMGSWKRLTSDTSLPSLHKIQTVGVYSLTWNFASGQMLASVGLDYPFRGYHDLTVCYRNNGWNVTQLTPGSGKDGSPCAQAVMEQDVLRRGLLVWGVVDERGRWLRHPALGKGLKDRIKDWLKGPTTYQLQVFVTGYQASNPKDQEQVRQLFEEARSVLARQLSEQMQRK